MTTSLRLSLKPGERIFINGAVLRVDRKVSLELLNDANFLLSHHILLPEQATSPLRQLYYVIQSMLMSPNDRVLSRALYRSSMIALSDAFENHDVLAALLQVARFVDDERPYEALKILRKTFAVEAHILGHDTAVSSARIEAHASQEATPAQERIACS